MIENTVSESLGQSRLSRIVSIFTRHINPGEESNRIFVVTEGVIAFSLLLYVLFAPHSIAVTQGAFLLGLVAWGVQLIAIRRFRQRRTPVDVAIFGFFACCVISSFLSYDPLVSIKGLKSPAFFLAFYFVSNKVRTTNFARFLVFALIASTLINVAASAGQIAIGRGLRINSIEAGSPLSRRVLQVGDVILEADGQPIKTEDDLLRVADSKRGRIVITYERNEAIGETTISRKAIRRAQGAGPERLGITSSPGRNIRVTGLYSHYETYAEVLQLLAALAVGMLIAYPKKRSGVAIFLATSIVLLTVTLIMTSTRAPMAGLAVAVIVMAFASSHLRTLAVALLAILILAPIAMVAIERSRGAILFDPYEGSTAYRLEVWGEALGLIKAHPLVGIGKGSEARLKERHKLYDNGRLPPGHFHSTPIQVAAWWGLPALAFYFSFMTIFLLEAWKLARRFKVSGQWGARGVALGGIGVLVAFNVSSLVHFNFGDGEVVMMLWLVTGLLFAVRRSSAEPQADPRSARIQAQPSADNLQRNQPQPQEAVSESTARAARARPNS